MNIIRMKTDVIQHWEWQSGLYQKHGNDMIRNYTTSLHEGEKYMIIGRGIGGQFGMRINCNPELAIIEVVGV